MYISKNIYVNSSSFCLYKYKYNMCYIDDNRLVDTRVSMRGIITEHKVHVLLKRNYM